MNYLKNNSCALVLAGGKGSRSIDPKLPKILQEIGPNERLLDLHLKNFSRANIPLVYFLVGFGAEEVKNAVRSLDSKKLNGLNIEFINDPSWAQGTTDAVINACSMIPEVENFTIFLGDEMFMGDVDFMYKRWRDSQKQVGVVLHKTDHPLDSDTVVINENCELISVIPKNTLEKLEEVQSNLSASGILFLDRIALDGLEAKTGDITRDLIDSKVPMREVFGLQTVDYLKDTGTPKRIMEARKAYSSKWEDRFRFGVPAIFMDRDGTLIPNIGDSRKILLDTDISSEVALAIREVNAYCIPIFMVTNQPGVAKGFITHEHVEYVHAQISKSLSGYGAYFDGQIYCPHHELAGFPGERRWLKVPCECRKPKPGMINYLSKKFRLNLYESFFLGDSETDREAARQSSCNFIFASLDQQGPTSVANKIKEARERICRFDNN
jgi:mannose-1-phosphate guanylyltransferase/phosphomannomutase